MEPFLWDGSHIGNIEKLLYREFEGKLYFNNGEIGLISFYKDAIPLIMDEMKPLFGLKKIGRHVCIYKKKRVMLSQYHADMQPGELTDRIALYRYVFALPRLNKSSLRNIGGESTSIKETKIDYTKKYDYKQHDTNWEGMREIANRLCVLIRFNMEDIIRRIDSEYIWIISFAMTRIFDLRT